MPINQGVEASSGGKLPGAPTIGSATLPGAYAATVSFTAPAHMGKPAGTT